MNEGWKKIIFASIFAGSVFLAACGNKMEVEKIDTEKNVVVEEASENDTEESAKKLLQKIGNGCEVLEEGDHFEKAGMSVTVHSSKITKKRGNWINTNSSFDPEEDENGRIVGDEYYLVVNMSLIKNDGSQLCLGGMDFCCVDSEGNFLDGSWISSSSYHSRLPKETFLYDPDIFIDYPKVGEKLENEDFIFAIREEKALEEDTVYYLDFEDETGAITRGCDPSLSCLVLLNPVIEDE